MSAHFLRLRLTLPATIFLLPWMINCDRPEIKSPMHSEKARQDREQYQDMEYNLSINHQVIAPDSTAENIRKTLSERLSFLAISPNIDRYRLFFVDSRSRALNQSSLLVRIRSNLTTPRKSDIVLKSRNKNIDQVEEYNHSWFTDVSHEIDVVDQTKTYSISHEIAFTHGEEFDADRVSSPADVLNFIGAKSREVRSLIERKLGDQPLIFPGTVDRFKFEGSYKNVPVTIEVWAFDKNKYLGGLSFKGKAADQPQLECLYANLRDELEKVNMLSKESMSKTQAYFLHFGFPDAGNSLAIIRSLLP